MNRYGTGAIAALLAAIMCSAVGCDMGSSSGESMGLDAPALSSQAVDTSADAVQVLTGVYNPPDTNRPVEQLGKPTEENMALVHSHMKLDEVQRYLGPGSEDIPENADQRRANSWLRQHGAYQTGGKMLWWSNGTELLFMGFDSSGDYSFIARNFASAYAARELGTVELGRGETARVSIESPVKLLVRCEWESPSDAGSRLASDSQRIELSDASGTSTAFGSNAAILALEPQDGVVTGIVRNQFDRPVTVKISFEHDLY